MKSEEEIKNAINDHKSIIQQLEQYEGFDKFPAYIYQEGFIQGLLFALEIKS